MNFLTLSVISFFFSFQLVRFECLDKNPILKVTLPWNCLILFGNSLRNQKSKKKKNVILNYDLRIKKWGVGCELFPTAESELIFYLLFGLVLELKKKESVLITLFQALNWMTAKRIRFQRSHISSQRAALLPVFLNFFLWLPFLPPALPSSCVFELHRKNRNAPL